jgi:hypothetical protein
MEQLANLYAAIEQIMPSCAKIGNDEGRVDGILSAKAPGDAAAFKNWLR